MAKIIISLLLIISFTSEAQMPYFYAHNQHVGCVVRTPPLDAVTGATAAYSLSKLRTNYTGAAIRIITYSNAEYDIGFTACGDLDTVTLKSHWQATKFLYVIKLYDQSGNGFDLTSTVNKRPLIVDSLGVIQRTGNKPSLYFDGNPAAGDQMTSASTLSMGSYFSSFYVIKNTDDNSTYRCLFSIFNNTSSGPSYEFYTQSQATAADWVANDAFMNGGNGVTGNPRIVSSGKVYSGQYSATSLFLGAANSGMYINGSEISYRVKNQASTRTMSDYLSLGSNGFALTYIWQGYWQELIIYTTDKSSDKSTMESNINSYYSIY
jgi:hypothetical protein